MPNMNFTLSKNMVIAAIMIFVVGCLTFNEYKTTGLLNPGSILKQAAIIWMGFQTYIAHQHNPDGSKVGISSDTVTVHTEHLEAPTDQDQTPGGGDPSV